MNEPTLLLSRLSLTGFKTIRRLEELELGPVNVLIGPNGAGKSNLVSFFRMLNRMMIPPGNLQLYVARAGGANTLLHSGAAFTPQMEASLTFKSLKGINDYRFRLLHAAQDTLIFAEEQYRFAPKRVLPEAAAWIDLGAGQRESNLLSRAQDKTAKSPRTLWRFLVDCVVHQFHNTSETARIRQRWSITDNWRL
ncbi:MAG: AAA family ATPase, partial [Longimicrobiaceae bacterium]